MRKSILMKLCLLALTAAMLLSLFACNGTEKETEAPTTAPTEAPVVEDPTEAPTQAPTEAPTQAPTEAPVVETTEAPVVETTEAPVDETTEAPVDETTEAPVDETTEAPTEEPTEAPVLPEDDFSYTISMVQGNLDNKVLYLTGEMDGYYFATTEDEKAAKVIRMEATEGGFYMFYYADGAKVYINIVQNGDYTNAVFAAEATSVWAYDETLGTMVTKLGELSYFLGTRNDKEYTTFSPCETKYADNFKAKLNVPSKCSHDYLASEEGHWKIACARCEKPAGSPADHYFYVHHVNGTVEKVDACVVCGYIVPIPENVQYLLENNAIKGTKTPNFQFTITEGGEDEATETKFIRFAGSAKSATHAAQSIWVGKSWGGERINAGNSKYLAIKMRGTGDLAANTFRFYLGASGNAEALGGLGIRFDLSAMITEGEWTWIVIDLEKALVREDGTDIWVANEEGNYMIDHMYFHSQPHAEDCYYDFATMAFVSDWAGVQYMMKDATEFEFVTGGGKNTVTESASTTILNAAYLEGNAANKGYKMKHTLVEENGATILHWDPDDDVGQYILTRQFASVPQDRKPVVVSNDTKYFVIRARQNNIPENVAEKSGFSFTLGNYTQTSGRFGMDLDQLIGADWTTIVIDLNAVDPNLLKLVEEEGDYNGKLVFDYVQVTLNATTATYDIAYMGFAESLAALEGVSGGAKATLIGAGKAVSTISLRDGGEYVADPVVLDAEYIATHNPRVNWKLTVGADGASAKFTGVDGSTGQLVMIQEGRDASFTADSNVAVETARFAIIRVKASVEDLPMRWNFGTSAAAGKKTSIYFKPSTEYKTFVVDLATLGEGWVANEDGTYTINVMNLYFGDGGNAAGARWTAETNVWVDYVAFATTWAQVDALTADETVEFASTLGEWVNAGWIAAELTTQDITVDPTATPAPTVITWDAAKLNGAKQHNHQSTNKLENGVLSFTGTTAEAGAAQFIICDKWRAGQFDVKDSKYVVFTVKTTGEPQSFRISFSTTATDPASFPADDAQFWIVVEGGAAEWTTFVVDLEAYSELTSCQWAAVDGKYVIDRFVIDMTGASTATTAEIKSIVFTDSWAGIDSVVEAETVKEITNKEVPKLDETGAEVKDEEGNTEMTLAYEIIDVTIADEVAAEQAPAEGETPAETPAA